MKIFLATVFIVLSFFSFDAFAQVPSDESSLEGHYLGLQGNELIRQLLTIGDVANPDNPYLINYSYNSANGRGINVGFALRVDEFDQQTGFSTLTTEIDNFALRVGYERKKQLDKRFVFSLGFDILIESFKNKTINEDNFNSQILTTETKTTAYGLGPRLGLNYRITDKIILGTEANYYYKELEEEFEATFDNNPTNNESDKSDLKRLNFVSPSSLWLIIRL